MSRNRGYADKFEMRSLVEWAFEDSSEAINVLCDSVQMDNITSKELLLCFGQNASASNWIAWDIEDLKHGMGCTAYYKAPEVRDLIVSQRATF